MKVPNWEQKEEDFKGVPPGTYDVQVFSAFEKTSSSGHPMIQLKLRAKPGTPLFFEHLVFTRSGEWKLKSFVVAFGEKYTRGMEIVGETYEGRTARAVVTVEEYNGSRQNKIAKWLPPICVASGPAPGAETRDLTPSK